MVGAE